MTTVSTVRNFFDNDKTRPLGLFFIWALSIAALTASARLQVPMIPVPMTFQTAVILALPCLFGWRMGLSAIVGYFMLGIMGLPVFAMAAGSTPGPAYFMGPTGGYLFGFALAAFCVGYAYEEFPAAKKLPVLFAIMLAGHAIILSLGAAWLAYGVPMMAFERAVAAGITPFIIGGVLKSAIAACFVRGIKQ